MNDKEKYITEKLEQLAQVNQNPQRADACIENLRGRLQTAHTVTHKPHLTFKIAASILIIIGLFFAFRPHFIGTDSVAWADIVQKFRSMSFYNAVMYFKEDAGSEPKQIELWVSSNHKARVRVDSQVLFAENGKVIAGYNFRDIRVLKESEYDAMAEAIIEKLCQHQQLSLDNIVQMVYKGQLQEITPQINSDAMISEDLLVFDVNSTISPEWMRIWTLRESKLPVRLRMWDPRDGECMDTFVTYDKQQPDDFFDPKKYEDLLIDADHSTGRGRTNLAYAYLCDPGGRDYVPQDLFEKSGYHMPDIQQIGITEHGAVWIIAAKGMNTSPDGNSFYGFSSVTDNLGRKYTSEYSCHYAMDDISAEIFVPADYPFDTRIPNTLTIVCEVEQWHPDEPQEIIGILELTEWQANTSWPSDRIDDSVNTTFIHAANKFIKAKDYDKVAAIVEMIQNSEEANNFTHSLAKLELRKLISQEKFAEADALAEQLWPVELEKYLHPIHFQPNPHLFKDFIIAIAANGRVERAAQLWQQLKKAEPDLSRFSKGAQQHMRESLQQQFKDVYFIFELFNVCNLNLEQVNTILGFDVMQNERTKWRVPEKYRRLNDPDYIAWNRHLEELAEYYKAHPLEVGGMELRKRDKYGSISVFTLPGLDDYRISPIGGTLNNYVRHYQYPDSIGRVKFQEEFKDIELQHELIIRGDVEYKNRRDYILAQFGLDVIEGQDDCTVWVAEYDGRQLPDYKSINVLNRYSTDVPGGMSCMISSGMNLTSLFNQLRMDQDIVVENNTGIDDNTKVSKVALNFKGTQGAEMAEQWYKDNFGITFRKEIRRMPVWIVCKKE